MRALLSTLIAAVAFANLTVMAQTNTSGKGTLVVGILTIKSSYAQNVERPSRGVPDTVQFWVGPDNAWRIRTYVIDHDIHTYRMSGLGKQPSELATAHIRKHYGDVLASIVILEFPDVNDTNSVRQVLAGHHLEGRLEAAKTGFAFWNPDGGHYKTQTTPK